MSIEIRLAYNSAEKIGYLFTEYTEMQIKGDSSIKKYLKVQNYDEELQQLKAKYGLPYGRLYAAYWNGELAGCIGLKYIDSDNCEMKRFYVRPQFRGKQIGNRLVQKIVSDARRIGYRYMLLDTLPFLKNAIYLYEQYGFYEIQKYNNSPMDTSIYMRLDL